MLTTWILDKLRAVSDESRIVIRDPFQILGSAEQGIREFADTYGFIVIASSTNLVFRELYQEALKDPKKSKLILIDRTPIERQGKGRGHHAPALFYPDFVETPYPESAINVDLQGFLFDTTGERWPDEVNARQYTRLMSRNLKGVLEAYENLRKADSKRFSDEDLRKIVAFAALGIGSSAFRKLESKEYLKIGLLNHAELKELTKITPEVIQTVNNSLKTAEKPFCWFADHDPDLVIRGFYLSLILCQHTDQWRVALREVDSTVQFVADLDSEKIKSIAPDLIMISPEQADADIADIEDSLTSEMLEKLLFAYLHWDSIDNCCRGITSEHYSSLIRSCGLILALKDLLFSGSESACHDDIYAYLFGAGEEPEKTFVDERHSQSWELLRNVYGEAYHLTHAGSQLRKGMRALSVIEPNSIQFKTFWSMWNDQKINRLEYQISAVERMLNLSDEQLLPRRRERLPQQVVTVLDQLRNRITQIKDEHQKDLEALNRTFQDYIKRTYPSWVKDGSDVVLTSSFLERLLKPHWDPEHERAVIFIFDGMRYDIWDTMIKPYLLDYMDIIEERQGCSLIPSETKISRNAISAGTFPDNFNPNEAENILLQNAIGELFQIPLQITVESPEGLGIGQTVRYRDSKGYLEVYIMDFCDNDLHAIPIKEKGGRKIPARPLFDVYERIKSVIDRDVLPLMRGLDPGTKVFVTADHGFGSIGTRDIFFKDSDLADPYDCNFLNCALPARLAATSIPDKLWQHIVELKVEDIRMPKERRTTDKRSGSVLVRRYGAYVFPRPGYAFSRPHGRFKPPAFSHGGISLQELIIPMVVLQVKQPDQEPVTAEFVQVPSALSEGEEAALLVRARHAGGSSIEGDSIRATIEVRDTDAHDQPPLARRVVILPAWGQQEIPIRYCPEPASFSPDERGAGHADRKLSLIMTYQYGRRRIRKMLHHTITVNLNPERIVRRVGGLGNILGLTPKGSQGSVTFK